ncbi:hypothetical protein FRB94_001078 [Tulasnella sp. JGI-2019a]|nr:hypothetical protein FRB94_001078 [Tulasnella sp. JGI-2019a]
MKILPYTIALAVFLVPPVLASDAKDAVGNTIASPCPNLPDSQFYQGWYNLTQPSGEKLRIHLVVASERDCYYATKVGHATKLLDTIAVTSRSGTEKPVTMRALSLFAFLTTMDLIKVPIKEIGRGVGLAEQSNWKVVVYHTHYTCISSAEHYLLEGDDRRDMH